MPDHLQVIISSLTSGSAVAFLLRYFITKTLRDISIALDRIDDLAKELAIVVVKLERIDRDNLMLHDHDRKIAGLESAIYGSRKS